MYGAKMCTSFTDKCKKKKWYGYARLDKWYTGWWRCESTPKDGLPDPRGSLMNKIPSHAIEQANQEVRQEVSHSQHASNQVSNA